MKTHTGIGRPMKTGDRDKRYTSVRRALATAFAIISASSAAAVETVYFTPPAAHVEAWQYLAGFVDDFDGMVDGQIGDLLPRIAIASVVGGSGYAESSKNHYVAKAYATGDGARVGGGHAWAHWLFIAHDPAGRSEVTLNLKAKASATTADSSQAWNNGSWVVSVCVPELSGFAQIDGQGTVLAVQPPSCAQNSLVYQYEGVVQAGRSSDGAIELRGGITRKRLTRFNETLTVQGTGLDVSDDINESIPVISGLPYLVMVYAGSFAEPGGASYAVVDPVLEPASVNPDVTIEFPNLAVDPNPPALLSDLTPEMLVAKGINPQPFVDLGFFGPTSDQPPSNLPPSDPPSGEPPSDPPSGEPPSDAPPPGDTPPPVDKDWCGPGFWLNNATRYGASAWPGAIPTYYDYNSTAGQMVGCPTARNNPSLLQALQNPDAHFDGNRKGDGFNCVADFLSGNAGLGGTKSDNSGVCSIDQLGRRK